MDILDEYVNLIPMHQNAVNLFESEWSSKFPSSFALETQPGIAGLFEDGRIAWGNSIFGGFSGSSVLELGPLECGHTFMLQNFGARHILAIEANKRAFMKCLIAKSICKIDSATILLGDFVKYLENTTENFDWTVASGVLYHMKDPIGLLKLISERSSKLLLWTHYFDQTVISSRSDLSIKFDQPNDF